MTGLRRSTASWWLRVEAKNSRAGASSRIGYRFVSFTQEQFASWVLESLGGSAERIVQCAYCNRWLSAATFVVDHRIPLGWPWLGSPALNNLALSCASCNQRKGCMSDDGFISLLRWATSMLDSRDMADMLQRMAGGAVALKVYDRGVPKHTSGIRAKQSREAHAHSGLFEDGEVA